MEKKLQNFVADIYNNYKGDYKDPQKWVLSREFLNAVLIGYELPTKASRLQIHQIGQGYGLIPLCPGDLIGVNSPTTNGKKEYVVRSMFGDLVIK